MWFEYNAKNQTSSITPMGGSPLNLSYTDVDSTERVQAGDTSFVSGAFGITVAQAPAGNTHYTRDDDGNLIGQRTSSGNYYYYLFDGLGSVIGLTDAAGVMVNRYAYDPYGNTTSATEAVPNPWRFAGGYLDSQTGLYKFGTRYYDSKIGRWTQQDPMVGSIADPSTVNRYVYVRDDPVNFVDPTGLYCVLGTRGGPSTGCRGGGLKEFYREKGEFRRTKCVVSFLLSFRGSGPKGVGPYSNCPQVRIEPLPDPEQSVA